MARTGAHREQHSTAQHALQLQQSCSPRTARPPHASSCSKEEWEYLLQKHGVTWEAMEARKLAAGHPEVTYVPLDAWQYEPTQVRSRLQPVRVSRGNLAWAGWCQPIKPLQPQALRNDLPPPLPRTRAVRPIPTTLIATVAQQAHLGAAGGAVWRCPPAGGRRLGSAQ